jgi:hypothetical protein
MLSISQTTSAILGGRGKQRERRWIEMEAARPPTLILRAAVVEPRRLSTTVRGFRYVSSVADPGDAPAIARAKQALAKAEAFKRGHLTTED